VTTWKNLYRVACIAALTTGGLILLQMAVYVVSPPPGTVPEIFSLFGKNRLLGLLGLDLLYVIDNALAIPVLLAICIALVGKKPSAVLLGGTLALVGIVLILAANPSVEMMILAGKHASAGTEAQKTALLAAGEAMLARYAGTGYNFHLVLGGIGFIVVSAVMYGSGSFRTATAVTGMIGNALTLGYLVPGIGMYLLLLSVVFIEIWYVLMGIDFIALARSGKPSIRPPVSA
jgi:hypothetical protein